MHAINKETIIIDKKWVAAVTLWKSTNKFVTHTLKIDEKEARRACMLKLKR